MSLILLLSILIRIIALGWSILVVRRQRDWRIGFLGAMLALMATRQILTLITRSHSFRLEMTAESTEIPGLVVSIMAFLAVMFLDRMLTEFRKIESELRTNEERLATERAGFRKIIEAAPLGVQHSDLEGRITLSNPACAAIFGCQPKDLTGKFVWDFTSTPEEKERLRDVHRTLLSDQPNPTPYECTNRTADGRLVHVRVDWTYERDAKGELSGFVSLISDITQRKKAEQALRESEARFRELADSVPVVIWTCDENGSVNYINPAFAEFTGEPVEKDFGSGWTKRLHPDEFDEIVALAQAELASPRSYAALFRMKGRTGEYRWFNERVKPRLTHGGEFVGFIATMMDVTEQIEAQKSLRESEEHFRLLARASPDVVFRADRAGNGVFVNDERWQETTGLPAGSWLGSGWTDPIHPEDRESILASWAEAAAAGVPWEHEFRWQHIDGSFHWMLGRAVPTQGENGELTGFVGTCTEITSLKESEASLRESEARLRESENRLRTIFEQEPECVKLVDRGGELIEMNPAGLTMVEAESLQQVAGQCLYPIVTEPYREAFAEMTRDVFDGETRELEFEIEGLRGTRRWMETRAAPLRDAEGAIIALLAVSRDITARKQAEQAKHEAENQLRVFSHAIANSIDGINITDLEGRIVYCNESSAGLFGYDRDELIGSHVEILNADPEISEREIIPAIRESGGWAGELTQVKKNGEQFPIFLTTSLILDDEQKPVGMMGICRDIQKEKLKEAALRDSERRYRMVFDQQFQFVTILSPEGRILEINDLPLRVQGGRREQYLGRLFWECPAWESLPEWQPIIKDRVTEALAMNEPLLVYDHYAARDGSIRYAHASYTAIRNDDGEVEFVLVQATDITERRLSEQALIESENRFRSAFEDAATPMALQDVDGAYLRVNDAFCELVGRSETELMKMSYRDLTMHEDLGLDTQLDMKMLKGKIRFHKGQVKRYIHREGHIVWVIVSASLVRDAEGRPQYRVVQAQDITERQQALEALNRSREELRNLNQSLERLVAERTSELQSANEDLEAYAHSVAHDLRAPLRAMYGFAKALREDYADRLDDDGREYTQFIESASHDMDDLIQDLLRYSKVGQGDMSIDSIDMDEVVERALEQLSEEIKERNPKLTVDRPLGRVIAHRSTLVQVVSNLVSNGLKFVADGAVPVIRIRSENHKGRIRLWVEDEGLGIDPEFQAKIFRVFERLHGVETYPGTGIGLAIVRRAAESLNGSFGVDSIPGQGSRFWVELPTKGDNDA